MVFLPATSLQRLEAKAAGAVTGSPASVAYAYYRHGEGEALSS